MYYSFHTWQFLLSWRVLYGATSSRRNQSLSRRYRGSPEERTLWTVSQVSIPSICSKCAESRKENTRLNRPGQREWCRPALFYFSQCPTSRYCCPMLDISIARVLSEFRQQNTDSLSLLFYLLF